jgi:cell division protein ZapA (FtsZ GTPase activity inhibitor)
MESPSQNQEKEAPQLIPVNVWVAGRSYRILIPPTEEAALRRSVKKADEQIAELRQHYAGKDDQDFVAMCLLMYVSADAKSNPTEYIQQSLEEMIYRIDKVLEKD